MTRSTRSGPGWNAKVRCAIYTRKSSQEGLDQEFNSLQAQREVCDLYHQPAPIRLGVRAQGL